MLTMRGKLAIVLALLGAGSSGSAMAADGTGLRAYADETMWPRWQARLLSNASFSLWRHAAAETSERRPFDSLSLLGDYYFSRAALGPQSSGGLRATSGLIFGTLSSRAIGGLGFDPAHAPTAGAWLDAANGRALTTRFDSAPYLGIGYTSLTPKTGWGFSADIGLAARSGSARLGRALGGAQSLDDPLRELRLTPLVNVGVSYSF